MLRTNHDLSAEKINRDDTTASSANFDQERMPEGQLAMHGRRERTVLFGKSLLWKHWSSGYYSLRVDIPSEICQLQRPS